MTGPDEAPEAAAGPATDPAADPAAVQAARHCSARAGRASAVLEDYVELIDDLVAAGGEARPTDLARHMGVSHPTTIKSIARLKALGLVHSKPYRSVFLTEEGQAMAARVRARHRVVVDLLRRIGVPPELAEADAEGIEHHVSEATLKVIVAWLARQEGNADG